MQPYKASCHCGAIRFSFEAEPFTQGDMQGDMGSASKYLGG